MTCMAIEALRSQNARLLAALRGLNVWGSQNLFCACRLMDASAESGHSTACQQARALFAEIAQEGKS